MNAPSLSRQQRRALERHARGVDLVTASDKRWFEEHPGRECRIRRTAAAEIGAAAAVEALKPLPEGAVRFTLVRKINPDCRMRIFICGPAHKSGNETDESTAAALWDFYLDATPGAREGEFAFVALVTGHDLRDAP